MTIIGITADGKKISKTTSAGPASYSAGGFNITMNDLNSVDSIIIINNTAGVITDPGDATITGNVVTVLLRMFQYLCCSIGNALEAPTGTVFSRWNFTVIAVGN